MGSKSSQLWDVPFREDSYPSVSLISEPDGDSTAILVVAPRGLDAYPKYIVRFSSVYSVTCEEEAHSASDFGESPQGVHAYIWSDSPISSSYQTLSPDFAFRGGGAHIRHYVILGGDNFAGVVTASEPTIERIDGPTTINVSYAV